MLAEKTKDNFANDLLFAAILGGSLEKLLAQGERQLQSSLQQKSAEGGRAYLKLHGQID